jgi:hypothetical protein
LILRNSSKPKKKRGKFDISDDSENSDVENNVRIKLEEDDDDESSENSGSSDAEIKTEVKSEVKSEEASEDGKENSKILRMFFAYFQTVIWSNNEAVQMAKGCNEHIFVLEVDFIVSLSLMVIFNKLLSSMLLRNCFQETNLING